MLNKELGWGAERGLRLLSCSNTAVRIAVERLTLSGLNLVVEDLPLCSEQDACDLEEFIPRAKEGLSLRTCSDDLVRGQINDFINLTTPGAITSVWNKLSLTDRQNTLPEYWQTVSTLAVLGAARKVSFFSFAEPPENLGYEIGMAESYWMRNTDVEGVWALLGELEILTRQMLYSDRVRSQDLLKIGHFYSASREIAKIFIA